MPELPPQPYPVTPPVDASVYVYEPQGWGRLLWLIPLSPYLLVIGVIIMTFLNKPKPSASRRLTAEEKAVQRANAGTALHSRGEHGAAIEEYTRAIDALPLAPETDGLTRADLLIRLGEAQTRAGDAAAAKEAFLAAGITAMGDTHAGAGEGTARVLAGFLAKYRAAMEQSGHKQPLKTWSRQCDIVPEFVGHGAPQLVDDARNAADQEQSDDRQWRPDQVGVVLLDEGAVQHGFQQGRDARLGDRDRGIAVEYGPGPTQRVGCP